MNCSQWLIHAFFFGCSSSKFWAKCHCHYGQRKSGYDDSTAPHLRYCHIELIFAPFSGRWALRVSSHLWCNCVCGFCLGVCVVLCKGFDIERVLTKCPTLKSARPSVSEECLYWCSLPKKSLLERDFESGSCTHALLSTFPSNGIQSNLGLTCL